MRYEEEFVAGASSLSIEILQRVRDEAVRQEIKSAMELLCPSFVDEADKEAYKAFVRSQGGPLVFARALLGKELTDKLRKHVRLLNTPSHPSVASDWVPQRGPGALRKRAEFQYLSFVDMVYGNARKPVAEVLDEEWRTKLCASVEQEDPRRVREDQKGDHLQVDWQQINYYSIPNPDSDHPLRRKAMGKRLVGKLWLPNLTIRMLKDGKLSNTYVALADFGPWSTLGEHRLVKEFTRRWYQDCSRLQMVDVPMYGEKTRVGAMMLLPQEWHGTRRVRAFAKEGYQLVLCCPMSQRSAEDHERAKQPRLSYRKTVMTRGQQFVTTKKVGPMILEVTCWLCKEQGNGYAIVPQKKTEMTPYEWGATKKRMLREGWTESSHPVGAVESEALIQARRERREQLDQLPQQQLAPRDPATIVADPTPEIRSERVGQTLVRFYPLS